MILGIRAGSADGATWDISVATSGTFSVAIDSQTSSAPVLSLTPFRPSSRGAPLGSPDRRARSTRRRCDGGGSLGVYAPRLAGEVVARIHLLTITRSDHGQVTTITAAAAIPNRIKNP